MRVLLAEALLEFHAEGFAHCDLKPDNITFDFCEDGTARVGHARRVGCLFDERPVSPACDVLVLGYILRFLVDQMRGDVLEKVIAMALKPSDEVRPTVLQVHDALAEILEDLEQQE